MIKYNIYQGKQIREGFAFDSRFFHVNGKQYEIVESESYGAGLMDVRHTIKGDTERKEVEMRSLVKMFKEGKLS